MSLFALAKQKRQEFAATPEGQKKALRRKKGIRLGKAVLVFLLIAFAILFLVITLNANFHWWTTLPWTPEQASIASSEARKALP